MLQKLGTMVEGSTRRIQKGPTLSATGRRKISGSGSEERNRGPNPSRRELCESSLIEEDRVRPILWS